MVDVCHMIDIFETSTFKVHAGMDLWFRPGAWRAKGGGWLFCSEVGRHGQM